MCRMTLRAFNFREHVESVHRRPEHSIQLRSYHHIARLQYCQQRGPFRSVAQWHGAGHPSLDEDPVHRQTEHQCVAGDGPLLNVEALAFLGQPGGTDPGVSVDRHVDVRSLVRLRVSPYFLFGCFSKRTFFENSMDAGAADEKSSPAEQSS